MISFSLKHLACLILLLISVGAQSETPVQIETNQGTITLALDEEKAPATVANFVQYAEDGFYDGTIFHRVIDNFMIQGGGFTEDFQRKATRASIKNEADNGLKNQRGTIAMARTRDPHSATAQFFINVKDNAFLDHTAPTPRGWGYAVFGRVTDGMDVVDKIRAIPTSGGGPFPKDVPQTPVVIESVKILSTPAGAAPAATSDTASE